jgi:hypothetical protein
MDARSTARRRFGHSGILYEKSFVMYDRKTESLWVHVTGRAEAGPLKGKQLPFFPSTVTTWARWRASYPNTLVLPGRRRDGFMGTYDGLNQPADLGLAAVVRFKGKLYPFRDLERARDARFLSRAGVPDRRPQRIPDGGLD